MSGIKKGGVIFKTSYKSTFKMVENTENSREKMQQNSTLKLNINLTYLSMLIIIKTIILTECGYLQGILYG